jgi:hypothetical protein
MGTTVETARLEITTNADQYAGDVKKIDGATKGMSANLGRSALEASRAIEDLQYGIGGVVNNIPGLVSALGGGAGAMAAFSLGAVAIAQVAKQWQTLMGAFENRTTIPKVAGDVAGLQKELEKSRDRMKELGEKSSVTVGQLAEYNGLRKKTAEVEKEIAAQMERQQRAKTFDALKNPATTAAEQARAGILQPMFGDPENAALAKAVEAAMPKAGLEGLQASLADVQGKKQEAMRNAPFGLDLTGEVKRLTAEAERLKGEIQKETESIKADAKDLAAKAVTEGKEGAVKQIREMMAKQPGAFSDFQRQAFDQASPAAVKEQLRAPMRADDAKRMKALDEALAKQQAKRELGDENFYPDGSPRPKTGPGSFGTPKVVGVRQMPNPAGFDQPGVPDRMVPNLKTVEGRIRAAQRRIRAKKDVKRTKNVFANANRRAALVPQGVRAAPGPPRAVRGDSNAPVIGQMGGMVNGMADVVENQAAIANQLNQVKARLQQVQGRAKEVNRFMQQPGPTNLPGGQ